MTTAVQHRRGTTAEHSTFTGLEGEVTIDTTKDTAVIHDGVLAGGYPLAKENLANVTTSGLSSIDGASTASDDKFFIYDQSATTLKTITRAELNNAIEKDALANVAITGGTINGTAIGGSTAAAGSFTTLTTSSTVTHNGGTANGVAYLNGSKVLTTGSALTFDGSNALSWSTSVPLYTQTATTGTNYSLSRWVNTGGTFYSGIDNSTGANFGAAYAGVMWHSGNYPLLFGTNGSERMRLTSTGLGIGTSSPGYKLDVSGVVSWLPGVSGAPRGYLSGASSDQSIEIGTTTNSPFGIATNGTRRLTLDTSGNLGLGVTPSATSATYYKSFELARAGQGLVGSTSSLTSSGQTWVTNNSYLTYSAGNVWKYANSNPAALYLLDDAAHKWYTAASGTAGAAITFTQAMTLSASGSLGLGITSPTNWGSYQGLEINGTSGGILSLLVNTTERGRLQTFSTEFDISAVGAIPMVFNTNGSERARIDSSGNLCLGTTSASGRLTIDSGSAGLMGSFNSTNANGGYFSLISSGTVYADIGTAFQCVGGSASDFAINARGARNLVFGANNTERARITSGGYFKASNSGSYDNSAGLYHELDSDQDSHAVYIKATNASLSTTGIVQLGVSRNTTNNSFYALSYYNGGAAAYKFRVADSGNVTNTNGSYGTISDAKMKTDIVDAGSQWADIKAIRFRKFKMKDDPEQVVQLGVVAQEIEQTSPGLVEHHTDRDAEGNDLGTTTKSVKTSVLLMKAAVALQEAMARIEKLEAKVAALESK